MNIFQKEAAYLNLSPAERSMLTTLWSLLRAAGITGIYIIGNLVFTSTHVISWPSVIIVGVSVAAASFADGVTKLVTASNDPPLAPPLVNLPAETIQKISDTVLPTGVVPIVKTSVPPTTTGTQFIKPASIIPPPTDATS